MLSTDADLVQRFNAEYSNSLKNGVPKKGLFEKVCKKIFELHGYIFGFKNTSQLKSFIRRSKEHKRTVSSARNQVEVISEGSGLSFTLNQIEELGLNPDSYY